MNSQPTQFQNSKETMEEITDIVTIVLSDINWEELSGPSSPVLYARALGMLRGYFIGAKTYSQDDMDYAINKINKEFERHACLPITHERMASRIMNH